MKVRIIIATLVVVSVGFGVWHATHRPTARKAPAFGWGYIDRSGRWVIKPRFEEAREFNGGLAYVVCTEGTAHRFQYIDKNGRTIIDAPEGECGAFHEGLASFRSGQDAGYIDKNGRIVIKAQLDTAGSFSEGLAAAIPDLGNKDIDMKFNYGYIDITGRFVIRPSFYSAGPFAEGLAAVSRGAYDGCGYIDKTGRVVIPPGYEVASSFSEGLACVGVTHAMRTVRRPIYEPDRQVEGGGWTAKVVGYKSEREPIVKYGYINKTGKWVIKPAYDSAGSFSGGLAPAKQGDKWGFINRAGRFVIAPKYQVAGDFCDGLARVKLNYDYGYIDRNGKVVIPSQLGHDFSEGLAAVRGMIQR